MRRKDGIRLRHKKDFRCLQNSLGFMQSLAGFLKHENGSSVLVEIAKLLFSFIKEGEENHQMS